MINIKKTVRSFSSQSSHGSFEYGFKVGGYKSGNWIYGGAGRVEFGSGVGMVSRPGWGSAPTICPPITAVRVNQSLLAPLNLEIDPSIHAIWTREKEEIKILNNRFASLIDKVCKLEKQNKMLETKWSLLKDKTNSRSSIDVMFEKYIADMRRQLQGQGYDKHRLETRLRDMKSLVEDFKSKYEEEINQRHESENQFVLLKKDADVTNLNKMDLECKMNNLSKEVYFLSNIYDKELHELQCQIKNTSVVVEMDNRRDLDMDAIVAEVRAQYEEISNRNRTEAESWYKLKFEEMQLSATKHGDELKSAKAQISEYKRKISRIHSEMEMIKGQQAIHQAQMANAVERGEVAVREAKLRVQELEAALLRAKKDMARQVREYQSLMNIKLALDIEIATYKKLLEGEESRLFNGFQTLSVSKQNSFNYDLEGSHLTRASFQSAGNDVPDTSLVKQEIMVAMGDSGLVYSLAAVAKTTKSTFITSETEKKLAASEGHLEVIHKSKGLRKNFFK